LSKRAVAAGDEDGGGAGAGVPAGRVRQTVERLAVGPDGARLGARQLHERRPRGRAGDRAAPDLVQRGVLGAALGPAARAPGGGGARVDAGAAAAVLGLVELPVDDALDQDEDHAEEHREERDADVGLEVPLLRSHPPAAARTRRSTSDAPSSDRRAQWQAMRETEEERAGRADLEAEVLAEEGVGLRDEARGAPGGGRRGVHRRASGAAERELAAASWPGPVEETSQWRPAMVNLAVLRLYSQSLLA